MTLYVCLYRGNINYTAIEYTTFNSLIPCTSNLILENSIAILHDRIWLGIWVITIMYCFLNRYVICSYMKCDVLNYLYTDSSKDRLIQKVWSHVKGRFKVS